MFVFRFWSVKRLLLYCTVVLLHWPRQPLDRRFCLYSDCENDEKDVGQIGAERSTALTVPSALSVTDSLHIQTLYFSADRLLPSTQVLVCVFTSAPSMSTTCLLNATHSSSSRTTQGKFQLFRLTRSCAKTSIAIPLLPFSSPILWLLPQSYTKKHQLYRLRVLNREKRKEGTFGTYSLVEYRIPSPGCNVKGLWLVSIVFVAIFWEDSKSEVKKGKE